MYPIAYEADYERNPNRWTTGFRLILAIPWLIVGYIFAIAGLFTYLIAAIAVLILGRYPEWAYNFNSGLLRYFVRLGSYTSLQTDKWPPFAIGPDPTYPVRVNIAPRAEKQKRWKALFRTILPIFLIPPLFLAYIGIAAIHWGASAVAWWTIVFRGYQPAGVHNALMFTNGWYTRVGGYILLLTDDYPPVGAEQVQVGDVRPSAPAVTAGAESSEQTGAPETSPGAPEAPAS